MLSPIALFPFVLPLLLGLAPKHPHNPKALILQGAAGKTTVTYFTVPFNAEHLKDLAPGFQWHLGYAALETEVTLDLGGQKTPPGRYKLDVVRGADDTEWSVALEPFDLWRAKSAIRRARDQAAGEAARAVVLELQKSLQENGIPERVVAPTTGFVAADAEHLEMTVLFTGYDATERFGTEPAGGMQMKLRLDFGTLHREIALQEVFVKK